MPSLADPLSFEVNEDEKKADAALNVRFYKSTITDKDHIRIEFPGDDRAVIDRCVREGDKIRFSEHWDAYQGGGKFEGQTRLEEVNWLNDGHRAALGRKGVATIEQLAGLSDEALQTKGMYGMLRFRQKAVDYVASKTAKTENEELRSEMAAMRKQLAELTKQKRGDKRTGNRQSRPEHMAKMRAAAAAKRAAAAAAAATA